MQLRSGSRTGIAFLKKIAGFKRRYYICINKLKQHQAMITSNNISDYKVVRETEKAIAFKAWKIFNMGM